MAINYLFFSAIINNEPFFFFLKSGHWKPLKTIFLFLSNSYLDVSRLLPLWPHLLTWLGLWTSSTLYLCNLCGLRNFPTFSFTDEANKRVLSSCGQWGSWGMEPLSPCFCITIGKRSDASCWLLGWDGFSGLFFPAIPPLPNSKTSASISRWRKKGKGGIFQLMTLVPLLPPVIPLN